MLSGVRAGYIPIQAATSGTLSMIEDETTLYFKVDMSLFEVRTEIIKHEDALLSASWGDKLYRTILTLKNPKKEDIIKSISIVDEAAKLLGVQVKYISGKKEILDTLPDELTKKRFNLDIYLKMPF